jgi:hypothetical protein
MNKNLSLMALVFAVCSAPAQGTIAFDTTLPPFGGGQAEVLYLSGNHLFGFFGMNDLWFISVEFPASSTDPASSFSLFGPLVTLYGPSDGFPGGVSITYSADFTLDENQVEQLLAGQAQIKLVQDLFSTDPDFSPQTFQDILSPVPEPQTWRLLMLGAILFFVKRKRPSFPKAARVCWNSGN